MIDDTWHDEAAAKHFRVRFYRTKKIHGKLV